MADVPTPQQPGPGSVPGRGAAPAAGTGLEDMSFLTVAEVAAVMRVSKMTVYRMLHSGALSAVRVGRSFRVPAKAVREYLSEPYAGNG